MEYVALFQLNMAIFFVVIWKHVWRILVYKVKEKKTRGGIKGKKLQKIVLYKRKKKMKKLSSKKKIRQIRMLNKNIQKMKLRKNKRVKDKKKEAERERLPPRSR